MNTRHVLFIIAFCCTSIMSFAQATFGMRAGINLASIEIKVMGLSVTTDDYTGLSGALIADFPISNQFSLHTEAGYIQKGGNLSGLTPADEKLNFVFDFVEVSALPKFSLQGAGSVGGYLMAGPSVGYTLSGNTVTKDIKEEIELDGGGLSRTELSATIGGGLVLDLGSNTLIIDLRYMLGLTNLLNNAADLNQLDLDSDDVSWKNRGLGISIGILL